MGSEVIAIKRINSVYLQIYCDDGIARELWEKFSFEVPNAKYDPRVKTGRWDGYIRLFSLAKRQIYCGLLDQIKEFAKENDYEIEYLSDFRKVIFSVHEAKEFIKTLNLPSHIEVRDYQLDAFVHAVREGTSLNLLPTGAGKSLLLYLLVRYYNTKTLLIVPTVNLVNQMKNDFADYGYDAETNIHQIFSGQDKNTDKLVTFSTWQSLQKLESAKLPKSWWEAWNVVIVDEVHTAAAKALTGILTTLTNTFIRVGVSGTLDGKSCNEMVLTGLFAKPRIAKTQGDKDATTSELIEQGYLSELKIKILILGYNPDIRKHAKSLKEYIDELNFVINYQPRNEFTVNLALSLSGVTIVMFRMKDHGEELYRLIKEKDKTNRKVYLVHGELDKAGKEIRNNIKELVANEKNAIIVCSFGVFQVGVNVPNIENIIFASPSKTQVRVLQSIGRGLRLSDGKSKCTLFDLADDMTYKTAKTSRQNTLIKHCEERIKIYATEQFEYKIYEVSLK